MGKWTQEQINEMIGKTFGRLTVVSRAEDRIRKDNAHIRYWNVSCSCSPDKTFEIVENSLITGHTRSCGCLSRERSREVGYKNEKSIVGKRFGKLVVIKRVENASLANGTRQDTQWLCQCDCGNTKIVRRVQLMTGKTKSCGCLVSLGEQAIAHIFDTNNILYKPQFTFDDLRSNKNGVLRFDFGIKDIQGNLLYLVEYDGAQHMEKEKGSWESLENVIGRDMIKNDYCKTHNIQLIRIPNINHKDLTLNDLQPDTSPYLVA